MKFRGSDCKLEEGGFPWLLSGSQLAGHCLSSGIGTVWRELIPPLPQTWGVMRAVSGTTQVGISKIRAGKGDYGVRKQTPAVKWQFPPLAGESSVHFLQASFPGPCFP